LEKAEFAKSKESHEENKQPFDAVLILEFLNDGDEVEKVNPRRLLT